LRKPDSAWPEEVVGAFGFFGEVIQANWLGNAKPWTVVANLRAEASLRESH
jgi:hypothetical protein